MSTNELLHYDNKDIRTVWDDEKQERFFSVADIVGVLTESKDYQTARKYWNKLKERLRKEGNETVTTCHQLKLVAEDGKRRLTDVANLGQLNSLVQHISSPKADPFMQWLEQFACGSGQEEGNQLSLVEPVGGEIVVYQPDSSIRIEVRIENATVWLTQGQMAELFKTTRSNVTLHIGNVFKEGELEEHSVCKESLLTADDGKLYRTKLYNLDVIISVGYRVKSQRGTQFRIWATAVLRQYLLRGYAFNQQLLHIEQRMDAKLDNQQRQIQKIEATLADHQQKIDFFVRTNQPPVEGVLFEGQIFDAYKLVEALVKSAKQEIVLIDNYIDATVFDLLEKREQGVDATIYTEHVGQSLQHLQQLNEQQYGRRIEAREYNSRFHDRFLILDDALYHFGASFKDLGRRLFAFERMGLDKSVILNQL